MRRTLLVLALLAAPAPAPGQSPAPAPAPVVPKAVAVARPAYPSGSVVFVSAAGSATGPGWPLQFAVANRPGEPMLLTQDGTGAVFPSLPDGRWFVAVTASAPKEGAPPAVSTAVVAVQVGPEAPANPGDDPAAALSAKLDSLSASLQAATSGIGADLDKLNEQLIKLAVAVAALAPPTPTPPPAPPPAPVPAPAPYTGPVNAVLLYDASAAADTTAALRTAAVAADLAGMNATFYPLEKAANAATVAAWTAQMAKDGALMPCLYLTDPKGKVLAKPLANPAAASDVVAAILAVRGAR